MNGWIKHYLDGTTLVGSDEEVRLKRVSWQKSRCSEVVKVELFHNDFALLIEGPGKYWQSERWESIMGGEDRLVARRISRLVEEGDKLTYHEERPYNPRAVDAPKKTWVCRARFSKNQGWLLDEYVNQWCVLEIGLHKPFPGAHIYFAPERI